MREEFVFAAFDAWTNSHNDASAPSAATAGVTKRMMPFIAPSSVSRSLPTLVIDVLAPPALSGRKLQVRKFAPPGAAPAVKIVIGGGLGLAPPFIPASFAMPQNQPWGCLRTAGSTRPEWKQ